MLRFSQLSGLQLYQLFRYATFVAIGIVLAKGGFSLQQIGAYENLIFTSGLLTFFWVGALINSMLTLHGRCDAALQKKLWYNTFLILVTGSATMALSLSVYTLLPSHFLDNRTITQTGNKTIVWLAGLYILFNIPAFINEYILYLSNQTRALVRYAVLTSAGTLTVAVALLFVSPLEPLYALAYSLFGMAVIKFCYSLFLLRNHATFTCDFGLMRQHLTMALPLLLAIFISGSSEYVDGWIVGEYFSKEDFAIYRYGAKELPLLLVVANTFSAAMLPQVSAHLPSGLQSIKTGSEKMMHWMFPLTLVLLIISRFAYRYVFSPEFEQAHVVFDVYLLLIIPRLIFPQSVLVGLGKTNYSLISSVLEITLNISLSLLFAKWWGLRGIAFGTWIAFSADKLFLMAVCYFRYGVNPQQYIPLKIYVTYSIAVLLCYFCAMLMNAC